MVAGGGSAVYDEALRRRQALMGASGARALLKNFRVFAVAAFACLGGVLYGYNQGMFSGVLTMPSFQEHMGEYDPLDDSAPVTKKGWLTSILELGAWLGALVSGPMSEAISRKYGILVSCSVFAIGVVIQATAVVGGYHSILAGRFITGVGVGGLATIVPIYNSEVAPPEVRGALVATQQLAITFGIMISFWIDYGTNYIGGTELGSQKDSSWIIPICLQLAPALVLFFGMIFMPFSPRWLLHHGRAEQARKVLSSLRGLPPDHELVELEYLEIQAQSLFQKRTAAELLGVSNAANPNSSSFMSAVRVELSAIGSLFRSRSMFRRVIVSTVTMFFQQWTGINAVLYYAPTIFEDLGMNSTDVSLLATGVAGIAMFVATIPSVLWIDRLGRRPVLTVGALGMATCHMIIAVIVARDHDDWTGHKAAGWAAVVMVWLFVVNFGYSWGPCSWIIIAEIWPLSSRPYGVSLGSSSNWMNNFIVGQVTPDMLDGIGYGTYIIFGLLTYLGAAFIWFIVPETKRLSLEEMDTIFGSEGTSQADYERMEEINNEIGLTAMLQRYAGDTLATTSVPEKEKEGASGEHVV